MWIVERFAQIDRIDQIFDYECNQCEDVRGSIHVHDDDDDDNNNNNIHICKAPYAKLQRC